MKSILYTEKPHTHVQEQFGIGLITITCIIHTVYTMYVVFFY